MPSRQDDLERRQAADVKQQKQIDADVMNNKSGAMGLKANEEEAKTGVSSTPTLRYRQAKEGFAKDTKIPKEESREETGVMVLPVRLVDHEMMK